MAAVASNNENDIDMKQKGDDELKSDYKEFSSISTDPAAVMIAVGFFIFFISFFGTVGALRENICFLRTVSSFYVAF